MSTVSSHDVAGLDAQHFERWRRLHDERQFRVEQLCALEAEPPRGPRHDSVILDLRSAARVALREIDAALERMNQGRYGLCVECSRPLPDSRLDILPMAHLCMSCHYNSRTAVSQERGHDADGTAESSVSWAGNLGDPTGEGPGS